MVVIMSPPDARYAPLGRANKRSPNDIAVLVLPVLPALGSQLSDAEVQALLAGLLLERPQCPGSWGCKCRCLWVLSSDWG